MVTPSSSIILQAHESLYLPNNQYTILSARQVKEHGVEVNDKAKHYDGLQNIIVDESEFPLRFKRSLLHVSIMESTDEEL